jgi:DNA-directed RNA polymerase subunit RPC12/RpoP
MDSCIICYGNNNLIIPQNCKCKITFHKICLEKMKQSLNIDCPMCRHKIMIYNNKNQNRIYNEDRIHPLIYFIQIVTIILLLVSVLSILSFILMILNFLRSYIIFIF